MTKSTTIELNNGVSIPQLGLGVWQAQGAQAYDAIRVALELGYRHIDTARIYGNEPEVARAIKDSGIPREEIFVTTKLWNDNQGYEKALRAFDVSLERLELDYLDLYLIHWPVPEKRLESWKALEKIYGDGRSRAIGVSNFTIRHLDELTGQAKVLPAVNQVEFHPFLFQRDLLAHCRAQNIVLEAYSPLTHGERLDHPVVAKIARKYHKTSAQILVRFCIEHGLVVLPKSVHRERIRENGDVFDFTLEDADVQTLTGLNEDLRTCWDPSDVD